MIPARIRPLFAERGALLAAMLLVALFVILRPSIHGNDGVQNYAPLRSILIDGDLHYANEYGHYFNLRPEWFDNMAIGADTSTRRPTNLYGVGSAILWSPYVAVAHGLTLAAGAAGLVAPPADGYSFPYRLAVGIASCLHASLGLFLLFLLLRRHTGAPIAFWAVLLVWLASPLFFYMYFHPSMSHANSFLLASLLLFLYFGGDSPTRWAAIGAVAGLLVLTRYQDAALLAALVPVELLRLRDAPRGGRLARYALAALAALLVFSPQFLVWNTLHGTPFSGPREYLSQGTLRPWAPVHAIRVLFSPRHGLLYWHPALVLGAAGFLVAGSHMRLRVAALAGFLATWWVVASWSHWWAGASFGHRMFISSLPMLAVGAALLAHDHPRVRRVLPVVVVLFALWNFGCVVQYGAGIIRRDQPVTWAEFARNNFVTLPRMVLQRLAP